MADVKIPDWCDPLRKRQLQVRASLGLHADAKGWRAWIAGADRRVAGRVPFGVAVERYHAKVAELARGEVVVVRHATVAALFDAYAADLKRRLAAGDLKPRTVSEYMQCVSGFVDVVGESARPTAVGPAHFARWLDSLGDAAETTINRHKGAVRAFWRWANSDQEIPLPAFGSRFKLRAAPAADRTDALTPEQVARCYADVCHDPLLRAAYWLGLTCGFSHMDICTVPLWAVDVAGSAIDFARGKVQRFGVPRQSHLVPDARDAVAAWLDVRPDADIEECFTTVMGRPLYRVMVADGMPTGSRVSYFAERWRAATAFRFSALRKTFATLTDDHADQFAVDLTMGHKSGHAGTVRRKHYVTRVEPQRLAAVSSLALWRSGASLWATECGPPWACPWPPPSTSPASGR